MSSAPASYSKIPSLSSVRGKWPGLIELSRCLDCPSGSAPRRPAVTGSRGIESRRRSATARPATGCTGCATGRLPPPHHVTIHPVREFGVCAGRIPAGRSHFAARSRSAPGHRGLVRGLWCATDGLTRRAGGPVWVPRTGCGLCWLRRVCAGGPSGSARLVCRGPRWWGDRVEQEGARRCRQR